MSEYTVRNTDIQKQICELVGLKWEGLHAVTIKMGLAGTIEVDAQFYVMTKKNEPPPPFTKKKNQRRDDA
jgi:hypothetical protein